MSEGRWQRQVRLRVRMLVVALRTLNLGPTKIDKTKFCALPIFVFKFTDFAERITNCLIPMGARPKAWLGLRFRIPPGAWMSVPHGEGEVSARRRL